MLFTLLSSILPILICLGLGWLLGFKLKAKTRHFLIKKISYLVWLLLISIGFQFGAVLFNKNLGTTLLIHAFLYASTISIVTYGLLLQPTKSKVDSPKNSREIFAPIFECGLAIFMVVLGLFIFWLIPQNYSAEHVTSGLLYLLIFLIGIDLSTVKFKKLGFSHIKVPLFSFLALVISAFVFSFFIEKNFTELMVLGSGFGWFSLSGPLVSQLLGAEYGAFALLTDLIREFYAIILLYLFGKQQPQSAIGVCGATAMDSTLPFIKSHCSDNDVQIAIFIGFILTLLAPFFIVIFSSLL